MPRIQHHSITVWALLLTMTVALILPPPVRAITYGEEEELSAEMLRIIFKKLPVVEDPYITGYVNRVGRRILAVMPEQPFRYRFYVINQAEYNAFATPAGHIFVYSGLLEAMDSEDELAGILGHEIAHVYCRHISQKIELAKKMSWAQIAGMAAGVLLGAAGGGAAVAGALTMGSAATGVTAQLSFSRENETQADQLGLKFLTDAGYGTEGLLRVLKKIRGKQWFSKDQVPTYMMTHPAIEDRIAYVTSWIEDHKAEAKPTLKTDPAEFERIQTRLIVEYNDVTADLHQLEQTLQRDPGNTLARYRYGLVLARANRSAEAHGRHPESAGLPGSLLLPGAEPRPAGIARGCPLLPGPLSPEEPGPQNSGRPVQAGPPQHRRPRETRARRAAAEAGRRRDQGRKEGPRRMKRKRLRKKPLSFHGRSKRVKCIEKVPRPWEADRRAVE
ncbi:MAG: hypothetical protein H6R38_574 [Deltaproteobacteria bacterium]|nr:hypothetical protein [Deltaproteobacteria bacterium]